MKWTIYKAVWSALFVLLAAGYVLPATYYVAPTGNDSNPGTEAAPWLTADFSVSTSCLRRGDTIRFAEGTYPGTIDGSSGVWQTDALTLTAWSAGTRWVIDASGADYGVNCYTQTCAIEDFTVYSSNSYGLLLGSTAGYFFRATRGKLDRCGNSAIALSRADYSTFSQIEITNPAVRSIYSSGSGTDGSDNVTFAYCTIAGTGTGDATYLGTAIHQRSAYSANNWIFDHCYVWGNPNLSTRYQVSLDSTLGTAIYDSTFEGWTGASLDKAQINSGNNTNQICFIRSQIGPSINRGIDVGYKTKLCADSSLFRQIAAPWAAIWLQTNTTTSYWSQLTARNCQFDRCGIAIGFNAVVNEADVEADVYNCAFSNCSNVVSNWNTYCRTDHNSTWAIETTNLWWSGIVGAMNITADPQFCSAGEADTYRIRSSSPLWNAGTDAAGKQAATDILGIAWEAAGQLYGMPIGAFAGPACWTPSPTTTPTPSPTPAAEPSATPSPSPTASPTAKPSPSPSPSSSPTPSPSPSPTPTATPSPEPTKTPEPSPSPSPTPSPTASPSPSPMSNWMQMRYSGQTEGGQIVLLSKRLILIRTGI